MKNETLELIHAHGSVRHYKPDPVPIPMIETIVSAAQRTSTSSNLQAYSVVVTTDTEKRKRLAEICGNQRHIADAPVFLTWCADLARLDRACKTSGYTQVVGYVENFLVAAVDAAIAAQTAALAAESLGFGICYIGSIRNDIPAVIDLLNLPRLVFPITGLTMGFPSQAPMVRPRLPRSAVLHWEFYNDDQNEALQEYDQAMIATGIYKGREVPHPNKEEPGIDYGWIEHSARRVSRTVRSDLRTRLSEQGFAME